MSSKISVRNTTAPGVVAMFFPSWNGLESTWDGMPPFLTRSSK